MGKGREDVCRGKSHCRGGGRWVGLEGTRTLQVSVKSERERVNGREEEKTTDGERSRGVP